MDYRSWLGARLTDTGFDWAQAQISTMPHFLEHFTLHDSYWAGFWMEPPFETVAIFQWDRVWLERREGKQLQFPKSWEGSLVEDWPLLLIQFERVWKLESSYFPQEKFGLTETVSDATSRLLCDDERLALLEQEIKRPRNSRDFLEIALEQPLFQTSIEPIYENHIEIWHGGETRFLCLDASGEPIFIPDL